MKKRAILDVFFWGGENHDHWRPLTETTTVSWSRESHELPQVRRVWSELVQTARVERLVSQENRAEFSFWKIRGQLSSIL